jgi:hypothetical protein
MMITTVRGTFADVDGTLEIDDANPATATGEIRVQTASLSTSFGARDTHLRSAELGRKGRLIPLRPAKGRSGHSCGATRTWEAPVS